MAKLNGITLVSERIKYNGAEYVKSDEAAVVGDIVRHDADGYDYAPKGTFYEVIRFDKHGDPRIIDEEGDEIDADSDFAVFKRVEATAKQKPSAQMLPDQYVIHDGDVFVKESRPAKVGEYAKVIGGDNYETKIGDIVIIHSTYGNGDYLISGLDGKKLNGHKKAKNVIRATDDEVAEAKRKNVKVGDYVRITQNQSNWPVGTIVKVTNADVYSNGSTLRATNEKSSYLADYDCVEPVTPAEAEQARAEAAQKAKEAEEEAKWAKIGRKVGEFKAGDIVQGKRTRGSRETVTGSLLEGPDRHGDFGITSFVDGKYRAITGDGLELIAPVESLFN